MGSPVRLSSLTTEQLVVLWQRGQARAGDLVYERMRGLVPFLVRGLHVWDKDEYLSVGLAGMAEAMARFRAERGVKFVSYASHVIRMWLLRHLNRHAGVIKGREGIEPICVVPLLLDEPLPGNFEDEACFNADAARLRPKAELAVRLRREGHTLTEVGRRLGCSGCHAGRMCKRGLTKMGYGGA